MTTWEQKSLKALVHECVLDLLAQADCTTGGVAALAMERYPEALDRYDSTLRMLGLRKLAQDDMRRLSPAGTADGTDVGQLSLAFEGLNVSGVITLPTKGKHRRLYLLDATPAETDQFIQMCRVHLQRVAQRIANYESVQRRTAPFRDPNSPQETNRQILARMEELRRLQPELFADAEQDAEEAHEEVTA
jgi:hypothetical protein